MRVRVSPTAPQGLIDRSGLFFLESHQSDRIFYSIFCRSDKKKPLCSVIRTEYKIISIRYRLYESVPGKSEIREDKQYGSECEKTASLQETGQEHGADDDCIAACTYFLYACRGSREYNCECNTKNSCSTEYYHCHITLGLSREFFVRLYLSAVSGDEVYYYKYVCERKESHLADEIAASAHIIAQGRE